MVENNGTSPDEPSKIQEEPGTKTDAAGDETSRPGDRDPSDPGSFLEMFIGPNPEPYLIFFRRAYPAGANGTPEAVPWSWHWGGFLIPIVWLFYRKLYIWAAGVIITLIVVGMIFPNLEIPGAALAAAFATQGKRLYIETALRRIRKILERDLPPDQRNELIRKAGGVSFPGLAFGALITIAPIVLLFMPVAPAGLPDCDARVTRNLAIEVMEDIASERGMSTSDLRIDGIEELPGSNNFLRRCDATANVAGESIPVTYKLTWQDRENGIFQLEMEWK